MTVMMQEYEASDPSSATRRMKELMANPATRCPMCGRVPKWYYSYYERTSKRDKPYRCALHEITPVPGPTYEPDCDKVSQLY